MGKNKNKKKQETAAARAAEQENEKKTAIKQGKQPETPEDGESSKKGRSKKEKKDYRIKEVKFSQHAKLPKAAAVEDTSESDEDESGEEQNPNDMEIDEEDLNRQEEVLGSAEQPNTKMDPPPIATRKILHQHKNQFEKFWIERDAAILDKLEKRLTPNLKRTPYLPPFELMRRVKTKCIDPVTQNPTDANVWKEAFQRASEFKQQVIQAGLEGYNIDPPEGWITNLTGLKPPGSDDSGSEQSSSEGESSEDDRAPSESSSDEEEDSVDEFDPDGEDSIEALARASGAAIPLASRGDKILGYSARGNSWEVLVKQGRGDAVRYRMMPAKGVSGFNKKNPGDTHNLAMGQRGLEKMPDNAMKWRADQVKAIKGVAWKNESGPDENPLDILTPEFNEYRLRFPITRVLIKWSDGQETWETRTTLRNLYPKDTADRLIYQRAGIQEQRYRRGAKLPPLRIKKVDIPSFAPTASSIGGSQRWQARSSTPGTSGYRSNKSASQSVGGRSQRTRFQQDPSLVQSLEIDALREQFE
ncbi:hypothetical protein MMC10_011413 [Thelotrema lepadinum]|nr:hypothetical protein [Thelotrema lepadinum]